MSNHTAYASRTNTTDEFGSTSTVYVVQSVDLDPAYTDSGLLMTNAVRECGSMHAAEKALKEIAADETLSNDLVAEIVKVTTTTAKSGNSVMTNMVSTTVAVLTGDTIAYI